MARTTISIPDYIITRLAPHREQVNVSKLCSEALLAKVEEIELKTLTASLSLIDWARARDILQPLETEGD